MDFEEIYSLYAPQVFRVCMGYINDREHARDLAQETFIAVWQNLSSFRNQAKMSTWLFRIATNICLRALERKGRMPITGELPLHLPALHEEPIDAQLTFLYDCIAELEETDRIIISLLLEDLPQAEIAAIVGLTEVNTRVKIHRIKDKLAIKFRDHGQFE